MGRALPSRRCESALPRFSFAAEAAARHVPLKRHRFRQFTDTCRVAGLPADPETRHVGCALTRSAAPPLWFAAEAAARHVPLKRQSIGTVRCALWVQLARFWWEARGSLHHDRPHATPSLLPHNLGSPRSAAAAQCCVSGLPVPL